jgi:hypothetical protein
MPNQALQQTPPHVGFRDYDVLSAAVLLSWLFGVSSEASAGDIVCDGWQGAAGGCRGIVGQRSHQ